MRLVLTHQNILMSKEENVLLIHYIRDQRKELLRLKQVVFVILYTCIVTFVNLLNIFFSEGVDFNSLGGV